MWYLIVSIPDLCTLTYFLIYAMYLFVESHIGGMEELCYVGDILRFTLKALVKIQDFLVG